MKISQEFIKHYIIISAILIASLVIGVIYLLVIQQDTLNNTIKICGSNCMPEPKPTHNTGGLY